MITVIAIVIADACLFVDWCVLLIVFFITATSAFIATVITTFVTYFSTYIMNIIYTNIIHILLYFQFLLNFIFNPFSHISINTNQHLHHFHTKFLKLSLNILIFKFYTILINFSHLYLYICHIFLNVLHIIHNFIFIYFLFVLRVDATVTAYVAIGVYYHATVWAIFVEHELINIGDYLFLGGVDEL